MHSKVGVFYEQLSSIFTCFDCLDTESTADTIVVIFIVDTLNFALGSRLCCNVLRKFTLETLQRILRNFSVDEDI